MLKESIPVRVLVCARSRGRKWIPLVVLGVLSERVDSPKTRGSRLMKQWEFPSVFIRKSSPIIPTHSITHIRDSHFPHSYSSKNVYSHGLKNVRYRRGSQPQTNKQGKHESNKTMTWFMTSTWLWINYVNSENVLGLYHIHSL